MKTGKNASLVWKFVLSRWYTWIGASIVVLFHALFSWWFQPSLPMQGLVLAADMVSIGLGLFFAFRSPSFEKYVNRMPYEEKGADLERVLPSCTPRFQRLARDCVGLIGKIRDEFHDSAYDVELAAMSANLVRLAEANGELLHRSQTFGTREQKDAMDRMLEKQAVSLETMHRSLKSFSGNLTLIAANTEQAAAPAEDLKYINEGLQEIIEEMKK